MWSVISWLLETSSNIEKISHTFLKMVFWGIKAEFQAKAKFGDLLTSGDLIYI